jgi:hypothetical protein
MTDDVRRAFATLSLPADSSRAAVARRYKILVRRWHPDRFTGDPQGVVEATQRLRAINVAHDTIKAHWQQAPAAVVTNPGTRTDQPPRPAATTTNAFTRDQVDDIIGAILHRETLWERLKAEPWNRSLSLLLAIGNLAWSLWVWRRTPGDGTALFFMGVVTSGGFLPFVWSESTRAKVFGWFWLVFFAALFPAFLAYMARAS